MDGGWSYGRQVALRSATADENKSMLLASGCLGGLRCLGCLGFSWDFAGIRGFCGCQSSEILSIPFSKFDFLWDSLGILWDSWVFIKLSLWSKVNFAFSVASSSSSSFLSPLFFFVVISAVLFERGRIFPYDDAVLKLMLSVIFSRLCHHFRLKFSQFCVEFWLNLD